MKTFYCVMERVIHDITHPLRHPMDQKSAESYMMVYETTLNWYYAQEWSLSWCMRRPPNVQSFRGSWNSKNLADDSPNLRLQVSNSSDHSYNRADLLLPWEGMANCCIVWRSAVMERFRDISCTTDMTRTWISQKSSSEKMGPFSQNSLVWIDGWGFGGFTC